ncbi:MAG TPA: hypothetical protein ENJ27_02315 [Candidatus Moranbacteria bacterium]|nr:hypothetical protein [Candidatus Moranbacteria bacterium]
MSKKIAWNKGLKGKDLKIEKKKISCKYCKKVFYSNRKSKRKFCSRKCYYKFGRPDMVGANNHNFKGGSINNGYLRVHIAKTKKRIYKHRQVMEEFLGY